jgi:hypothetical protein
MIACQTAKVDTGDFPLTEARPWKGRSAGDHDNSCGEHSLYPTFAGNLPLNGRSLPVGTTP